MITQETLTELQHLAQLLGLTLDEFLQLTILELTPSLPHLKNKKIRKPSRRSTRKIKAPTLGPYIV